MKIEGSLRAHQSSVSALQFVSWPHRSLVSGDESGWVVWWSLTTRRPLGIWRAHTEKVISILQMDDGLLVTHSRDCTIKCWNLNASFDTQVPLSIQSEYPCPPLEWDMPVNALNFCNIDIIEARMLCPASVSSNSTDIYNLGHPLSRPVENMSPEKDHGIVMAVKWIDNQKYIVGYESGHVIVYIGTEIVDTYSALCPDPVTAIETFSGGFVACCASNSLLLVKDTTVTTLTLEKKGVSTVSLIRDLMALSSWDGIVRVYKTSELGHQLIMEISIPTPLVGAKSVLKATCVCLSPKGNQGLKLEGRDELVRKRDYMAVGYSDGRISIFCQ